MAEKFLWHFIVKMFQSLFWFVIIPLGFIGLICYVYFSMQIAFRM